MDAICRQKEKVQDIIANTPLSQIWSLALAELLELATVAGADAGTAFSNAAWVTSSYLIPTEASACGVNALALGLGISGLDDFTARIGAIYMISTTTVSYARFTKLMTSRS